MQRGGSGDTTDCLISPSDSRQDVAPYSTASVVLITPNRLFVAHGPPRIRSPAWAFNERKRLVWKILES